MKIKRYKKIRKILHSYQITHNIKAPFKVAVDGEFLQSALAGQIMLKEQLPKMLQEERTTVYVTPCIDNWLRLKGPQYSGALFIASKLAHLKCRHDKGFVRPFDCIRHLIANGNPDHLLIGAQDEPIRKLVRHCAGVPLLFIHGSTAIMEAPTITTKEAHADEVAKQIAVIQKEEKRLVHEAKKGAKAEGAGAAAGGVAAASSSSSSISATIASKKKKKPKGPKQPNPLSVKKKKTPAAGGPGATSASVKKEKPATSSDADRDAADGADARPAKKIKTESGAASVSASASSAAASPAPAPAASSAAAAHASSADAAAASSSASGSKGRKRARSYKKKAEVGAASDSASSSAPAAAMDDAP